MSNLRFDFTKKRVLITGAGQGIGLQIAKSFAQAGATVIVWEKSLQNIEKLQKDYPRFLVTEVDVSCPESCKQAASSLQKPIDFLINNAGILRDKSLAKMSFEMYSLVISTNLNSVFLVTKTLLDHFNPDSLHKRIVNLSSIVALHGNFGQSNYVAAKAGVIGLTRVWSKELAKKSFTVNALAPGFIETDILKAMSKEQIQAIIQKVPVARVGTVQDISNSCLFLCSQEASYINGAVLEVTGGISL